MEEGDGSLERLLPVCGKDNIVTFKNIFYVNAKANLAESHIWISIFYRPTSSHFTRVQRVSCALVFLMFTMISNAVYFNPEGKDKYINPNLIEIGPFAFTTSELYISFACALITLPPTVLIILLFKKTIPRAKQSGCDKDIVHEGRNKIDKWLMKRYKQSVELEKKLLATNIVDNDNALLPHWMLYVTWFLVALSWALPAFFILLYSMEWGKQASEEWLTSFLLSFFEATFLLDPIKVSNKKQYILYIKIKLGWECDLSMQNGQK